MAGVGQKLLVHLGKALLPRTERGYLRREIDTNAPDKLTDRWCCGFLFEVFLVVSPQLGTT